MGNRGIVITVVIILGVGYWFLNRNSPEDQIKKRLDEIKVIVEQNPLPKDQIEQLKFGKALSNFAAKNIKLIQGEQNQFALINSQSDVRKYATLAPRYASSVNVSLLDLTFFEVKDDRADTEITIQYKLELRDGRKIEDQATGNVSFFKEDGEWVIDRIETLQVFK